MSIANEISRITAAKGRLLNKAQQMGLGGSQTVACTLYSEYAGASVLNNVLSITDEEGCANLRLSATPTSDSKSFRFVLKRNTNSPVTPQFLVDITETVNGESHILVQSTHQYDEFTNEISIPFETTETSPTLSIYLQALDGYGAGVGNVITYVYFYAEGVISSIGSIADAYDAIPVYKNKTVGELADGYYVGCSIVDNDLDTSDATAAAAELLAGRTAYVKGSKITGTMANRSNLEIGMRSDGSFSFGGVTYPAGTSLPTGYYKGNKISLAQIEQELSYI